MDQKQRVALKNYNKMLKRLLGFQNANKRPEHVCGGIHLGAMQHMNCFQLATFVSQKYLHSHKYMNKRMQINKTNTGKFSLTHTEQTSKQTFRQITHSFTADND